MAALRKKSRRPIKIDTTSLDTTGETGELPRLRVLSYNIHQGLTIHRRQIAISILKEAILALRADLVILQEVAGSTDASGEDGDIITTHQLEELADEIWPYHAYGRNAVFSGGFHGNAILSRYPIRNARHIDITVKPLDKRGMLHGELEVPGFARPVHVVALHLGLLQYERHAQLRKICRHLNEAVAEGDPCLMAGDFNDWRQKVSRRLRKRMGMEEAFMSQYARHARTFPSRFPVLPLDRIYYRGIKLELATRLKGRPWFYLSDHLPLMADFRVAQ